MKEQLKKLAKEKYNLNGIVYIFDNGNIFVKKEYADKYANENDIKYDIIDLDEKEIENKKGKK
jgi:hypothetical protein